MRVCKKKLNFVAVSREPLAAKMRALADTGVGEAGVERLLQPHCMHIAPQLRQQQACSACTAKKGYKSTNSLKIHQFLQKIQSKNIQKQSCENPSQNNSKWLQKRYKTRSRSNLSVCWEPWRLRKDKLGWKGTTCYTQTG